MISRLAFNVSFLLLSGAAIQAATILTATGYKLDLVGNPEFEDTVSITPATASDSAPVTYQSNLFADARYGALAARAAVANEVGAESFASAKFTDTIDSPTDGTISIPIVINGDFLDNFGGLDAEAFLSFGFTASTTDMATSVLLGGMLTETRRIIRYEFGTRSFTDESFTNQDTNVTVTPLAGYGSSKFAATIVLPLVTGMNSLDLELSALANCYTAGLGDCSATSDFAKTVFLGPSRYFDENGTELDASLFAIGSGFRYEAGTPRFPAPNFGEIPEPSTFALLGIGLLVFAAVSGKARRG